MKFNLYMISRMLHEKWCHILLLIICGQIILQTNAVSMCTNGTSASPDVSINLINGTGVSGCYCSVKLHKLDTLGSVKPQIKFVVKEFSGCKYNLVISYNNTGPRFSCSNIITDIFYNINKTDEIKLYLESTNSSQDDTTFEVKITSSSTVIGGPLLRLECFLPNATEEFSTTQQTTSIASTQPTISAFMSSGSTPTLTSLTDTQKASTSGSPSGQTSVSESESTTVLTQRSSPGSTSDSVSDLTTDMSSANTSPKTQITSESKISNDNDLDIGLIGGVVGGVLILVVVIIVLIVCIVRHRTKKRDYCRPTFTRSEHGYTDIDLQAKRNNSSTGNVIKDNVPYSADPAVPQQPKNCEKTSNGQVEMEIIENDLYVSSDDIDDYKLRDGNITNHNPEISNGQSEMEIIENDLYVSSDDMKDYKSRDGNITNHNPEISNGQSEMEIIENDLYVSSDDALNSPLNDDDTPVYAVVNKKPKLPSSDVNDNSKDGIQNDLFISL